MATRRRSYHQIEFDTQKKNISRLKKQCDDHLHAMGGLSTGATVEVDYFPLTDLLRYCSDVQAAMQALVKVMEAAEYLR